MHMVLLFMLGGSVRYIPLGEKKTINNLVIENTEVTYLGNVFKLEEAKPEETVGIQFPAKTCVDTDIGTKSNFMNTAGGLNPEVKGSVILEDNYGTKLEVEDTCVDNSKLNEYLCTDQEKGGKWYAVNGPIPCVEGSCKDGACTPMIGVGEKLFSPEQAKRELEYKPICGDGKCEDREKQVGCDYNTYIFDDGQKYDICWSSSINCPVDCGIQKGDFTGCKDPSCSLEKTLPICGDGKCEGVESKKICKKTSSGLEPDEKEFCQSACLNDCGIIARNSPKDFILPIEIPNKDKGPFGIANEPGRFDIVKEPIFRFYTFNEIGECNGNICLEKVNRDSVSLKIKVQEAEDKDLFNLYGIIPKKEEWKIFDNILYYNHIRIGEKGKEMYKQYTPIFNGIVEIEYYPSQPPLKPLTEKQVQCIDNFARTRNIDVPEYCKISTLSANPVLSPYGYTKNQIYNIYHQCLQQSLITEFYSSAETREEANIDFETNPQNPVNVLSSCVGQGPFSRRPSAEKSEIIEQVPSTETVVPVSEEVPIPQLSGSCNGCLMDNKCLPYGTRLKGNYCDIDNIFILQKDSNVKCENNYECGSNLCIDNNCVSASLWQKILAFFKLKK